VRFAITALGVESSVAPIPNTFVTSASVLIGIKGGGIEGKALPPPVPEFDPDPEPVPPAPPGAATASTFTRRWDERRHGEGNMVAPTVSPAPSLTVNVKLSLVAAAPLWTNTTQPASISACVNVVITTPEAVVNSSCPSG
jgi:hypothetical protein